MLVIRARNVSEAWPRAIELIKNAGVPRASRNGPALVLREPVTTVYSHPAECVLLDPVRDSNPFFSVLEAMWMLAGRDDARWLDQFVSGFSDRFAEEDGRMHGAYGRRWRSWFRTPEGREGSRLDQLESVVRILRRNPNDRQAVVSMWDPSADLEVPGLNDRPCNTQIYFRADFGALDMTVTCRSNDIVMGCYGANAVHFSFLLQYMAARIGLPVGTYRQVSNNWHAYTDTASKADALSAYEHAYRRFDPTPLVDDPETFGYDLNDLLRDRHGSAADWKNSFLRDTALPLLTANQHRREGRYEEAVTIARYVADEGWRTAATEWLQRRAERRAAR